MADYNIAAEAMNLFSDYEVHHLKKTDKVTESIKELTDHIRKLQHFLDEFNKYNHESERVDWSNDPEKIALVEEIRLIYPGLADQGVYVWKGKEIENLNERINGFINRDLTPQISQKSAQLTQFQYENNEVLEVLTNLQKGYRELMKTISSNIARARG